MKIFSYKRISSNRVVYSLFGIKFQFRVKDFGDNQIVYDKKDEKRIFFNLQNCHNNKIFIGKLKGDGKLFLNCCMDNSVILIGENLHISEYLNILMGSTHPNIGKMDNIKFEIGENSSIESASVRISNSNSQIIIGENCMISCNVTIWNTDGHPIFSQETGNIINFAKTLEIGNHCWIGGHSTILKNTKIAPNSIIGWGAVVRGKFEEEGSIIVGNPAIVKSTNKTKPIRWQCKVTQEFINNSDNKDFSALSH